MAKRRENGEISVAGGRAFEIVQYRAKPFSKSWRKNRVDLVKGSKPLITDKQIEDGLAHKMIGRWAYIWHDHCVYVDEDEANDESGKVVAGEPKFAHVHVAIETSRYLTVDVIARWFGVPVNFVNVLKGRGAFLDYCDYMLHETPKAIEAGKEHYEADEAVCSPGFDLRAELDGLHERKTRFGRSASGMTAADVMQLHVLLDGWTITRCKREDPFTYKKVRTSLPGLRLDYLRDTPPAPFRLTIYVDGKAGHGKTGFCRAMAEALFPDAEKAYFVIGNDERVSWEGYDGEPAVLFNEVTSADMLQQFGRRGVKTLLEPHPDADEQQKKGSSIILTNSISIINGIEPYEVFMHGVSSVYTDKAGQMRADEPVAQIERRIPLILCVHAEDFDLLVNEGFLSRDLDAVHSYLCYRHVAGSIANVLTKLGGEAQRVQLGLLTEPVVDTVHMLEAHHDDRITDPALIPDEFANYGEVTTAEELLDEYENVFTPLWRKVNAKALARGETRLEWMQPFDEWRENGCSNAYDKERGWYRAERSLDDGSEAGA